MIRPVPPPRRMWTPAFRARPNPIRARLAGNWPADPANPGLGPPAGDWPPARPAPGPPPPPGPPAPELEPPAGGRVRAWLAALRGA